MKRSLNSLNSTPPPPLQSNPCRCHSQWQMISPTWSVCSCQVSGTKY
jgi:hypothetical protein